MTSPRARRRWSLAASLGILFLVALFGLWQRRAIEGAVERVLVKARGDGARRRTRGLLRRVGRLDVRPDGRIRMASRPSELWDLAGGDDGIWAATGGGLLRWPDGAARPLLFDVRHGLPENRLRALRRVGRRLFVGTASRGLVLVEDGMVHVVDGLAGPAASIRCLHEADGELFVGHFGASVSRWTEGGLVFYGPPGAGDRALRVTCMAGGLGSLAVGTFARGLHLERDGAWTAVEAERLGGGEVFALAPWKDGWAVGQATGLLWVDRRGRTIRPLAEGLFVTALFAEGESLWVGTLGEGILRLGKGPRESRRSRAGGEPIGPVRAFCRRAGRLLAATDGGLLERRGEGWALRSLGAPELASNHVSALALDGQGRVWVGCFRDGLQVWEADLGRCLMSRRDERIREINHLAWDGVSGSMWVSTSAGAHRFQGLEEAESLGVAEGLLSPSVTAIHPGARRVSFATAGGVTWREGGGLRSLSTFHGLASNHCHALAGGDDGLWVGGLGGLSRVEGGRVIRRVTAVASGLPRNWVTALLAADEGLWIGTYGGGLALMDREGVVRPTAPEPRDFEVNFGALATAGSRLLAGTLDRGLAVVDRAGGRGRFVTADAASANVTAVAVASPWLYIGSDGGVTRTLLSRID